MTATREQAEQIERSELTGPYHYPLNIQGNECDELIDYIKHIRMLRRTYKHFHLSENKNKRARSN